MWSNENRFLSIGWRRRWGVGWRPSKPQSPVCDSLLIDFTWFRSMGPDGAGWLLMELIFEFSCGCFRSFSYREKGSVCWALRYRDKFNFLWVICLPVFNRFKRSMTDGVVIMNVLLRNENTFLLLWSLLNIQDTWLCSVCWRVALWCRTW